VGVERAFRKGRLGQGVGGDRWQEKGGVIGEGVSRFPESYSAEGSTFEVQRTSVNKRDWVRRGSG